MFIEKKMNGNKLEGIYVTTNINGYFHSEFYRGYTTSEEDIRECVQYFQTRMFSNKLYEHYMDLPFGKNLPFVTDEDCPTG
tara:strand:- start:777 stop:1019 length:243 start_codon:yes stop_codon:yes gene_type:complete